jgi:DNA modification methylase
MSSKTTEFGNYNMDFVNDNYFTYEFPPGTFDGIVTDPPYPGAIKNVLGEEFFDFDAFMKKTDNETKQTAFLITFSNFLSAVDFINASRATNWVFYTIQIWDKRKTNFISSSMPLRSTEYILYFRKGPGKSKANRFKFTFATGVKGDPYNRKTFGAGLAKEAAKKMKYSTGMYAEMFSTQDFLERDPHFSQNPDIDLEPLDIGQTIIDDKSPPRDPNKIHPTQKPNEFSYYFAHVVGGAEEKSVLDPFCGSGNLLKAFPNAFGVDITDWRDGTAYVEFNKKKAQEIEERKARSTQRKVLKEKGQVEEEESEEMESEGEENETRRNKKKRSSSNLSILRPACREYLALMSILHRNKR